MYTGATDTGARVSEARQGGNEMSAEPVEVVREAFEAFLNCDIPALRARVAEDLEWTYLDPSAVDPTPDTCYGSDRIVEGAGTWASLHLGTELEEIEGRGDKVVVILHAPGLDQVRARKADDRNFHVVTVHDGTITALRACRDRDEARAFAGFDLAGT